MSLQDASSGRESTKMDGEADFKTVQKFVYTAMSTKLFCSNLEIKLPEFPLTFKRDLEISWTDTKSDFPWEEFTTECIIVFVSQIYVNQTSDFIF